MASVNQDVSASTSVTPIGPHRMIPCVGTDLGPEYDEELSRVSEDSEGSNGDEKRHSKVALLTANNAETTEEGVDEEIPNSITEIEGAIPSSELGDEDDDQDTPHASIPSVVFMIPFPAPVNGHRSKNTSPFLLYTPPRAMYTKPPKDENGKKGKEKFLKKLVRHYQQQVKFGEQLKRKEVIKTGRLKKLHKARACCIRGASMLTKWLPSPCVETLARIPPKRKLGEVIILFPLYTGKPRPEGEDQPYQPTAEDLRHDISVLFRRTRKRILIRLIAAGCFMPIAAGADFFAPVFLVEITLAYLAFQVYGLRKIKALTSKPKSNTTKKVIKKNKKSKKKSLGEPKKVVRESNQVDQIVNENEIVEQEEEEESDAVAFNRFKIIPGHQAIFDPLFPLMYNICSRIDPLTFPPLEEEPVSVQVDPQAVGQHPINEETTTTQPKRTQLPRTLHKPDPEVVRELMVAFRANLPEDVQARHVLDEERVSEDLARYMKKAAVDYVRSLKGRPDRSPFKVTQKWFSKRKTVRRERKEKSQIKKQIKKEIAQDSNHLSKVDQPVTELGRTQEMSEACVRVIPKVESKQDKKVRIVKEKREAKEIKQKMKKETREQEKLIKLKVKQAKKDKKKAD
ncbi:hypothetical protein CROQUDRAFT_92856 [Cronartium quercuum f. sp. fusiforme G11]|uniref:Uncharacterized protein n=1 Tax=Cronartium quercuum f. sp. fusiforme G11 TaxID=708437 RepID=A0A9P6TBG8_9BASI|nr:hypothetical protein CROQUDRAFT_92856 [Cronartium quercuum f. sp. fusiforme G11]